jgi:uncharacterized iron-regulated membrane protein
MTYWQKWTRQPQTVWLRKAMFQLHLWSGIGLGLYVLLVSLTGSVLVYRNELYRAATRDPIVVTESGPRLTDQQLKAAAERIYPGYKVAAINRARDANQAVTITLESGRRRKNRLFNPYTGADLEDSVPLGIWLVSKLLELHDDLLAGPSGRSVNGVGAIFLIVLSISGIIVWWPGIQTWRRSLTIPRGATSARLIWGLHSMIGFWSFAFVLLFGVSGVYLGDPDRFQDLADRIEPLTAANMRTRVTDQIIYWLAYLHIGRIDGIGLGCKGPGVCDQSVKLIWALFGLAPAVLFVTAAMMWWNRVIRKKLRLFSRS